MKHNNTSLIRHEVLFEVGSEGQRAHLFTVQVPPFVDSLMRLSWRLKLSVMCCSGQGGCWETQRTKVTYAEHKWSRERWEVWDSWPCQWMISLYSVDPPPQLHTDHINSMYCDRMDKQHVWFHSVPHSLNIQFITQWKLFILLYMYFFCMHFYSHFDTFIIIYLLIMGLIYCKLL